MFSAGETSGSDLSRFSRCWSNFVVGCKASFSCCKASLSCSADISPDVEHLVMIQTDNLLLVLNKLALRLAGTVTFFRNQVKVGGST